MRRFYAFALALALVAAACGGSDDEATPTTSEAVPAPTQQNDADQATEPEEDSAAQSESETTETTVAVQALGDGNEDTTFYGNPPGTATVEVGDIKYEFDLSILCLSMFGAMGVAGEALDGSAVTVDADFPPEGWETSDEDWEPPSISIDDEERDVRWEAGGVATEMYPEGSSQVDSFTADGRLAVGEATFVNTYTFGDELQVETGQFEFHCPEG
jgi:hypothetical protein